MILTAPLKISKTNLEIPKNINSLPCGLFRANLLAASDLMPELVDLFESAPIEEGDRHNWEIDVKIHMLMPNQYPCIPNWHCDNVMRKGGEVNYEETYKKRDLPNQKMLIWLSGTPCTEFLEKDLEIDFFPKSHEDVAKIMNRKEVAKEFLEPQAWHSFDRFSPHRGTSSKDHCWRIFARLTHKSCLPERPKTSVIRKHSQVYLDASTFTW